MNNEVLKRSKLHLKKTAPKPKGHDALLQDYKDRGVTIHFLISNSREIQRLEGKVVDYDKYTITILNRENDKDIFTFYKHALIGFGTEVGDE